MIEISVQKAKQGDSIWIRCLSDENVVNIVIDAGPSTFQNGFKNMVKEIKEKKERINLLIFSHIDDDHIRGIISYLQKDEEKIIDKVWINGHGTSVYRMNQEHSPKNISSLVELLQDKNILVETPILEGKEYHFKNGIVKVIAPTEEEIINVAKKIDKYGDDSSGREHASVWYAGDIKKAPDSFASDPSPTNKASIIIVLEYDGRKLLFTGDSPAKNIIKSVEKYYPEAKFEIVKLPHHGSQRNISRELIQKLNADRFIISTNKKIEKIVLRRFIEEREETEILCNYTWWKNGYFTGNDMREIIDTGKLSMRDIGEEKVVLR